MPLSALIPFEGAIKSLRQKTVTPTGMTSAELSKLGADFHRQNFTSARTTLTDLLDQYKFDVDSIINPKTEQRTDRVTADNPDGNVTTGLNQAYAREGIKKLLQGLGYSPEEGEAGTLKDLSSDARINLVLRTNTEMAQGAGRFIQMNNPDVLDQFPAQELVRFEQTHKQRDWEARWAAAADDCGDEDAANCLEESGRMVALKDSDIWQALGDGAGGYDDTLGNPYPPFAFNSGMWVQSVSRSDAEDLGLIEPGEKAEAHPLDLSELFKEAA